MQSTELKAKQILQNIGFEVKPNKDRSEFDPANTVYSQVPFHSMRLDFALIHAKIAIEVDGDYWHGNAQQFLTGEQYNTKLRDSAKNKLLAKEGWRIIRIWERDLRRSEDTLNSRILNVLEV